MTIRIWQAAARRTSATADRGRPDARPSNLRTRPSRRRQEDDLRPARGRQRRSWRCPTTCSTCCRRTRWAFRDRTILTESPTEITQAHDPPRRPGRRARAGDRGRDPTPGGCSARWRPRADAGTITQVLTALCSLRAEDFAAAGSRRRQGVRPGPADDARSTGSRRARTRSRSALPPPIDRTLRDDRRAAAGLHAPLADRPPARRRVSRSSRDVVPGCAGRADRAALPGPHRRPPASAAAGAGPGRMGAGAGLRREGLDLSRIGSLVTTMSQLQTTRFIQYEGDLPTADRAGAPAIEGRGDAGREGPGPGPPHRQQRRRRRRLRRHGRRAVRGRPSSSPPRPGTT